MSSCEAVLQAGMQCHFMAALALDDLEASGLVCAVHVLFGSLLLADAAADGAALPTSTTWTATWPWMQPTGSSQRPSSGDVRPMLTSCCLWLIEIRGSSAGLFEGSQAVAWMWAAIKLTSL